MSEPRWLIECLGVDDTVRLIEISGGLKVWVPSGIRNSSAALRDEFDASYGPALAKKLVRYFGGAVISVPLAQKWRTGLYYDQGMPLAAIARKLQCSYMTVCRRLGHSPTQPRFPGSGDHPPSPYIPADPV